MLLQRVQADGSSGVVAEHVLPVPAALQTYVPGLVEPHTLAAEVQAPPRPVTFVGAEAEQAPVHELLIIPVFVASQLLAAEVQALPTV
ncbi:MAG: hypothetical protein HYU04_00490 [Candidatus Wildermuthbacteria bacterium]|nr:hypothetical protein [Candidatus Wildermuthbacteria bacterium]